MKKFGFIIFSIMCVAIISCIKDGVITTTYKKMQILENGELHTAHGHIVNCPAEGGEYVVNIISNGISTFDPVQKLPEWIRVKQVPTSSPTKEDIWASDNTRYLQEIRLELLPNTSDESRKISFDICSGWYSEWWKATVTLNQNPLS